MVVGRESQTLLLESLLRDKKSHFVAITGRRRVGKTYLIDEVYKDQMSYRVTGIQDANTESQITNFVQKVMEYSQIPLIGTLSNWQEVFIYFKAYLKRLSKRKKHVIFIDELPWMATARSGFIQGLAHLWNDYLSKEKHFILVVCGSATSWISKKIVNDKGGFHNRLSQVIKLEPFTLKETKLFLKSKKVNLTDHAIAEIYMIMGGIPFYLEQIRKGESPTIAIERLCFADNGLLKYEYDNLYKALFDYPENHEAIVKALATTQHGLTREEIIKKSKVEAGGPYTRAMDDLLVSGFIIEETPYGRKKRGALYRLIDEYSVFYHKFIHPNRKKSKGIWQQLSAKQAYKIWTGYAFETLCLRHIDEIKKALGIANVYTENYSYRYQGSKEEKGFQIDLIIDRNDKAINLCECKFYSTDYKIDKKYAQDLKQRKANFIEKTKTKKIVFTTMISNHSVIENEYALDVVDSQINVSNLMK